MFTKRLHVFKAGSQTSAQGVQRDFTSDDLQEVVDSYNPKTHEAPLVIGHSGDNDGAPSFGWIKKFVKDGDDLYADVNFTDVAKDLVSNGHYKKVSISFYSPNSPINPHKGKWSARHLALLGASPPAVKGLESFSFSEEGVFDFSIALSPDTIFDKELGPTMIVEKSPLELLKDRLDVVRGQINDSLQDLKQNQKQQQSVESEDASAATPAPSDSAQFAERKKKKMALEGEEVSEVSQKMANMETMAPEEEFEEGITRKTRSGAHGQKVQVVEQVFEEGINRKMEAGAHGHKVQVVEEVFEEKGKKKKKVAKEEFADSDSEDNEEDPNMEADEGNAPDEEFVEGVSHKTVSNGKPHFGYKSESKEDPTGRDVTGSSQSDSESHRDHMGSAEEENREGVTKDEGVQDQDRISTAKSADQELDRVKTAKSKVGDASDDESRWEDQPEAHQKATNNDQFDDSDKGYLDVQKPGVSDGEDPYGRDGGPTTFPTLVEEEPSNEDIEVELENVKDSDSVRVLYKKSGDDRAPIKGKPINNEAHEAPEDEYSEEVSDKSSKEGKAAFGKHAGKSEDFAGRGSTGRSNSDSYGDRQSVGKGKDDTRNDTEASDEGHQEKDREKTAKSSEQEKGREKLAKSFEESENRWAGQPEGEVRHSDGNQFGDASKGLPERQKPGVSDGNEPHGRDGGPTKFSDKMEEEPSNEEIAVPLQSTKGNKKARVLHQKSGDKRAPLKGGPIVDHAEGEADGLTREPKKARVSDGTDPRGRDGGPTKFPTKSEEDPDNLEMAVDLEDATKSKKVRIVRQKSGDAPSLDHKEKAKSPMTKTGKGSTYGSKSPILVEGEEIEEEFDETEEYCGMGSLGQAKAKGYPAAMFKELMSLKAENDRLKREYEEQKVKTKKDKIAEFVEALYSDGKLTDGIIPQKQLQNYCEGLEFGTLEFSEGESPTSVLFALLDRLPNLVYFGEVVSNTVYQDPEDDDMDPHEKAMKMVANGEAEDYVEAIKRCIPWGQGG